MDILILIAAVVLFIVLVMKNVPIIVATLLSSAFLLVTQGMDLYEGLVKTYMTGFGGYVTSFFLLFVLGALFGKLVEISGAATSVATSVYKVFGEKYVVVALIVMGIILTLGGVNLFVAMFTMYPLAMVLFRRANIPRKMFPGIYFAGCVGVTMTAPFTPSVQNVIPTEYLGTTVAAAAIPGIISSLFKIVVCVVFLQWYIKRSQKRGEGFEMFEGENFDDALDVGKSVPNLLMAITPMVVLMVVLNVFHQKIETALLAGIIAAFICYFKHLPHDFNDIGKEVQTAITAGLTTISITAAAAGYGAVVAATPAFQSVTEFALGLGGNPLVVAACATMIMAGVMNSSSGSMAIIVPILGEKFLAMGVNAQALHRIIVVASSTLDSTPQGGFVCNILNFSKTDHRNGYFPVFFVSVLVPTIETFLLILLMPIFGLG